VAVGRVLKVRDYGLLDAAVARPRATAFGLDAYPSLIDVVSEACDGADLGTGES